MRDKKWSKTTYDQRRQDWEPHDLIVEELATYSGIRKASQDEDYEGVDLWIDDLPFDVKVTDGIPKTYDSAITEVDLFRWFLERQDLKRFHPTNRIIVVLNKPKDKLLEEDAEKIARQIADTPESKYFSDIVYTLRGSSDKQQNNPNYGRRIVMRKGLLVIHEKVASTKKGSPKTLSDLIK